MLDRWPSLPSCSTSVSVGEARRMQMTSASLLTSSVTGLLIPSPGWPQTVHHITAHLMQYVHGGAPSVCDVATRTSTSMMPDSCIARVAGDTSGDASSPPLPRLRTASSKRQLTSYRLARCAPCGTSSTTCAPQCNGDDVKLLERLHVVSPCASVQAPNALPSCCGLVLGMGEGH